MKNILFLINNLAGGGAENVLTTLVNNLDNEYDITVQTIYNEGIYRNYLKKSICYKTIIKNPTKNKIRIVNRLIKYLPARFLHNIFIKENYDIEIGFLEGMSCKVISGCDTNIKKIGWIHTDLSRTVSFFYNKKAEKKCYDNLSDIVCVSDDAKLAFIKEVSSKNEPLVIHNPIDKQKILNKSEENNKCEINKTCFTICSVGRLVKLKGFDRLIEATGKLIKQGYEINVWILGKGELENELKHQVDKLGLNDYIFFLGFAENPYSIMKLCDLYICASIFEGYSISVSEAIVMGLPVISTDCAGMGEILGNGNYGMIVNNSIEGIYSGLKNILDDKILLLDMKKKSQERSNYFDLMNTLSSVKKLLD